MRAASTTKSRATELGGVDSRQGWWVVAASTLILSVSFGSTYLLVVALKPIAADFGWPRAIPSLAYSLIYFGAGFGGIAMGFWSDRQGVFRPVCLGAVAIASGSVLASFSGSMAGFLLAQGLLIGFLGNGSMFAPLMTNATRWFERRRGMAVAIVAAGQPLSGTLWPSIFRWGIENHGWRETMLGYGVLSLVIILPLSLALRRPVPVPTAPEVTPGAKAGPAAEVLGLPANLVQVALGIAFVGCCIAMSMPMAHIVAYCSDLGFATARGAEMLSVLLACAFASRLIFGYLADRIGGLKTILFSSSLQAVVLSLYTIFDGLVQLYLISGLFGFVFGGIVPSYALAVRDLFAERQAGWRTGVTYLFGTSGMGLGGYLGGLVFDLTGGYQLAFITGVGFNILNLAIIMGLVWRTGEENRRPPGLAVPA